jgi:hypothetical protein
VIDGRGDTPWVAIPTGAEPTAIAENTVQNRVYIANYLGSSISVIRDVAGIQEAPQSRIEATRFAGADLVRSGAWLNVPEPATLLEATGREVRSLAPGQNSTAGLSPGVYFIQVRAGRAPHKLLVVR